MKYVFLDNYLFFIQSLKLFFKRNCVFFNKNNLLIVSDEVTDFFFVFLIQKDKQ